MSDPPRSLPVRRPAFHQRPGLPPTLASKAPLLTPATVHDRLLRRPYTSQVLANGLAATPWILARDQVPQPGDDRLDELVVGREVLERVEVAHLQILVEPVALDLRFADEGLRSAQNAAVAEAGLERVQRDV